MSSSIIKEVMGEEYHMEKRLGPDVPMIWFTRGYLFSISIIS